MEFETGNDVRSSPAIGSDGIVYVGSDDELILLTADWEQTWDFETGLGYFLIRNRLWWHGLRRSDDEKLYALRTDSKGLLRGELGEKSEAIFPLDKPII